jgi:hypothetical protein
MHKEKQTLTRKELYDLVWSQPMLTLAKKYNISDTGLRKVCIRLNIPLPIAGHWQKIQFGKKINQPKLSLNDDVEQQIVLCLRSEKTKEFYGEPSPLKNLQIEIENQLQSKLIVPEKLTNPDKLIIEAKNALQSKEPNNRLYMGTVYTKKNILNIRVDPKNISRALLFWDTLVKALFIRGHKIEFKNGRTYVIIEGHEFNIYLKEKMKQEIIKDGNWNTREYRPTGILTFKLDAYPCTEWKDGKLQLEQQISKIIAKLELSGREWTLLRLRQKKEEEERKEKERIIKEFELLQEKDLSAFKDMLQDASRWHEANNLRNYINEVEIKSSSNNSNSDEHAKWLEWARKKADWFDPFIEQEDDLLKEVNKDTLTINKKTTFW